ncbi:MAG: M48 family metalloprotease [Bdellovibrionota bacterium]
MSIQDYLRRHVQVDFASVRAAKVGLVLGGLSFLLIIGGYAFASRFGLLFGFLAALSVNSLVFFYADLRLASLFPGRELEGQDPWGLLRVTKELARQARIPCPTLKLIKSHTPLAFSAGLLPTRSTIAISTALVEKFTEQEMRIVIAYEIHRLKTQATAASTAASALVGFITLLATFIDDILLLRFMTRWSTRARERRAKFLRHGGVSIGPMTLLVSPLVALLVRLSVSRRSIFEADLAARDLANVDSGLVARTLWKLDSFVKTRPFPVNLAEAHLFTVSPLARYPFWKFATAQPSTASRLQNLTGHAPL